MSVSLMKHCGIGLTGGVATGKSTVAALLQKAGLPLIDADQLARAVTKPGTPGLGAIAAAFGPEVLTSAGELNRARLGEMVFADATKRQRLEAITHPLIIEALHAALTGLGLDAKPRYFVYEAALLVETNRVADFFRVWATWCRPELQLQRLIARSGLAEAAARRLIASQMDARAKAERAHLIIDTSGDLDQVATQVRQALSSLPPLAERGELGR